MPDDSNSRDERTERIADDSHDAAADENSKRPSETAPTERVLASEHMQFVAQRQKAATSQIVDLSERTVGDFRLLRRLGGGGMADVYLAEQMSLKRQVAIKVLRPDLLSDDSYVKRFEQEAKSAGALNHPNIVQVYAIGHEEGVHFIAQEYVHGINMRDYVARKGPPEVSVALHLMKQVASALQAAGEAGIVHRDIKPENILLTRKGEAKVADFGLAQLNRSGERLDLTQVGMTMGTPLYMSPEQLSGHKLDARSDLYSFGVTCYHLLAGRPPFRDDREATALTVAVQHLNEEPPPLAARRPDLPRELSETIHRMMAKAPQDRFPNAEAVLQELKRIGKALKQSPGELQWDDETSDEATNFISRLARRVNTKVALMIVSCILAGLISAAVGWATRPSNPLNSPVTAKSDVQVFDTAQRQYFYAMSLDEDENKEEAWQAVIENFPDAMLEKRRAQEQLAILYLKSKRFEQAGTILEQFVAEGAGNESLHAIALAGHAIAAGMQGDESESQRLLAELSLNVDPISRAMGDLLLQFLNRFGGFLDEPLRDQLESALEVQNDVSG